MVARDPAKRRSPPTCASPEHRLDVARPGRVGIHQGRARLQAVGHRSGLRTGRALHGGGRRRASRPADATHEGRWSRRISEIESVYAGIGQTGFGSVDNLVTVDPVWTAFLPPAQRRPLRGDGGHRQPLLRNPRRNIVDHVPFTAATAFASRTASRRPAAPAHRASRDSDAART